MSTDPRIGENQYIRVDDVMAVAKRRLRLVQTSEYDVDIKRLVLEGARHVSSGRLLGQYECEISIVDARAVLPKNLHTVISIKPVVDPALAATDAGDNIYSDLVYVNKRYLHDCGVDTNDSTRDLSGVFQIQAGYVLLTWPVPAHITGLIVSYTGFITDADTGFVMIPADYERALVAYSCYNMLLDNPDIMSRQHQNLVPFNIKEHKTTWREQRAWLQSLSNRRDFDEQKYLVKRKWKAIFTLQDN